MKKYTNKELKEFGFTDAEIKSFPHKVHIFKIYHNWFKLKKEIEISCDSFKNETTWDDFKRAYATGQEAFRDKTLKRMKELEGDK